MYVTDLSDACFLGMFYKCVSLSSVPELPATTLAFNCYQSMFESCSSITDAPNLPANTFGSLTDVYTAMFYNCSSLSSIHVNFSDWNNASSTKNWVYGVPTTGIFTCPDGLPITKDVDHIPFDWIVDS